MCPLIIVVNIGPTMAVFKFYDMAEDDDSLKLRMTLSNMGDLNEQIRILWQQVNFLLQEYCCNVVMVVLTQPLLAIKTVMIHIYILLNIM